MAASKFLPNLIVNNSALSTGGGGDQTVSPNKNMMDTSKSETDTSKNMYTNTDMTDYYIYILINDTDFQ